MLVMQANCLAGPRLGEGSARDPQCSGKGMGWFCAVVEDAGTREKAEALCRDTIEFLEAVRPEQHSVSSLNCVCL